jgi:hypothetical protein
MDEPENGMDTRARPPEDRNSRTKKKTVDLPGGYSYTQD